jgi:hypothetical protein
MSWKKRGNEMTDQESMMLDYLMNQGGVNQQQQSMQRKQQMIELLRKSTQMPEGSMTQTGQGTPSLYVRPNPLQNLASIAGQGLAGYQQGQVMGAQDKLGQDSQDQFNTYAEYMRKKRKLGDMPADPSFGGVGAAPY